MGVHAQQSPKEEKGSEPVIDERRDDSYLYLRDMWAQPLRVLVTRWQDLTRYLISECERPHPSYLSVTRVEPRRAGLIMPPRATATNPEKYLTGVYGTLIRGR